MGSLFLLLQDDANSIGTFIQEVKYTNEITKKMKRNFKTFWQFMQDAKPILMGDELNDLVYINSDGTLIYNMDTKHFLKPYLRQDGRLAIKLKLVCGEWKAFLIHRLVAEAFIPNPENKPIVHHKNENPRDNRICNLMWVTEEEHKKIHESRMGSLPDKMVELQINSNDVMRIISERNEREQWGR